MLADYRNITSRIKAPILWYDDIGVPRYDRFHPEMAPNIYACWVIYYEIACQGCGKRFKVSECLGRYDLSRKEIRRKPTVQEILSLHYGDPPRHASGEHRCSGETMNCDDIRVLEFWEKDKGFEWVRDKSLEIRLDGEEPSAE